MGKQILFGLILFLVFISMIGIIDAEEITDILINSEDSLSCTNDITLLPICGDYTYSSCPEGCMTRCLSSFCSEPIFDSTGFPQIMCTSDCDGPGSCYGGNNYTIKHCLDGSCVYSNEECPVESNSEELIGNEVNEEPIEKPKRKRRNRNREEENSKESSIKIPIKEVQIIDLRTDKPIRHSHKNKMGLTECVSNWFKRFFS